MGRPRKYKDAFEEQKVKLQKNKEYRRTHKDTRKGNRAKPKAPKEFIAYDGEGFTVNEIHKYGLLMNSKGDKISSLEGLTTLECLNFLCNSAKKYPGIHVCFGASYDVNMMLSDIPMEIIRKLHSGKRVIWKDFSLEYRQRKCFTVSRFKQAERHFILDAKGKWVANIDAKIILWDVFGFFQGSFLAALEEYFTKEEREVLQYDAIKTGKDRRSNFTPDELARFIIPYTTLEVSALVVLMTRLREYFNQAELKVIRWDGAGAVAASILKKYNIKQYHGDIPQDIMLASQYAYGGGRIELIKYGHTEQEIYHYDINSAYPSAMLELPNLKEGKWIEIENEYQAISNFSLYLISWNFPWNMPFYPFFYRDTWGAIQYPPNGKNWVWYPEIVAAMKNIPDWHNYIHIHTVYSFIPDTEIKPYSFVQNLYDIRKQWKKEGQGAQKVLKLGINSLYGKTVQHLGYDEKTGKKPPFFQLQWGGYITSVTRAKLYDAAMQSPDDIISFATDGLWSLKPLLLDCGDNLGAWEYEKLLSGTFVQSGVYWTVDANNNKHQFYRGFDKHSLTEDAVLQAWKDNKKELPVECTRFVTLGSALASEERFLTKWRTWDKSIRTLSIHPSGGTKRIDHKKWTKRRNPSNQLIETQANIPPFGYASFPYSDEYLSKKFPLPWNGREDYEKLRKQNSIDATIAQEIDESQE